jgi:hypothetical protein
VHLSVPTSPLVPPPFPPFLWGFCGAQPEGPMSTTRVPCGRAFRARGLRTLATMRIGELAGGLYRDPQSWE